MVRILYICSSWPIGQRFGGQLRALQLATVLRELGQITVSVVSSDADDVGAKQATADAFSIGSSLKPVPTPVSNGLAGIVEKWRRLFDPRYLNVHGVQVPPGPERSSLLASRDQYDLVWVVNSRTPNLVNEWQWPHAHLDLDDIPSTYARSQSKHAQGLFARIKARFQQRSMRRRELLWKERFATLSVCSEVDRQQLKDGDGDSGVPIHVIPNGFPMPAEAKLSHLFTKPPRLGFIGLCTYEPNWMGVRWFLKECWPLIRTNVPGVRFRLVGKGAAQLADSIKPASIEGVDVVGWIDDAGEEMASWSATVIPIHIGGGTRVKLAEAFSRKCPVVSTEFGALGYDVQHERELLLADEPIAFARACIKLLKDADGAKALANTAYAAFLERWTWDAIAPRILAAAEDCLRRGKSKRVLAST
jgi:glycosyltransferase involved in cell wall biosynthesis